MGQVNKFYSIMYLTLSLYLWKYIAMLMCMFRFGSMNFAATLLSIKRTLMQALNYSQRGFTMCKFFVSVSVLMTDDCCT